MLEKVSLGDRQPVFGLLLDVLEDSRGLQQIYHYLHVKSCTGRRRLELDLTKVRVL